MGRRRRGYNKEPLYYCPSCKKRALKSCYIGGHAGWRCESEKCGISISVEGRDALITDHFNVLDLLARSEEERIMASILGKEVTLQRRGMDVLFKGEHVCLVKVLDGRDPSVCVYHRHWIETGASWPGSGLSANQYVGSIPYSVSGKGATCRTIFGQHRFAIYGEEGSHALFCGPYKAPIRKEMVAFTAALDKDYTRLIAEMEKVSQTFSAIQGYSELVPMLKLLIPNWDTAPDYSDRLQELVQTALSWNEEFRSMAASVASVEPARIGMSKYSGYDKQVLVSIHGRLTEDQVLAIAKILQPTAEKVLQTVGS